MRRCILLFGITSVVSLLLMLREFFVLFAACELALPTTFAIWLLLLSPAAGPVGRMIRSRERLTPLVAGLLATAGILTPATLVGARLLHRALRSHTEPTAGLGGLLLVTTLSLIPLCVVLGLIHAVAIAINVRRRPDPVGAASEVRLLAAGGAAAAGVAFALVLSRALSPLDVALLIGAMNLLAAFALWWHGTRRPRSLGPAALVLFLVLTGLLATPAGTVLDFASQSLRLHDGALRAAIETSHGRIDVIERSGDIELRENGLALNGAEGDTTVAVLPALLAHPKPQRVLLAGGVSNDALQQVLELPGVRVDCVELDPALPAAARQWREGPAAEALRSDRVTLITRAASRRFLRARSGEYDVVVVLIPDGAPVLTSRLSTREFFVECRSALRPDGVFALSAAGPPARSQAAAALNELPHLFRALAILPDWNAVLFLASPDPTPPPLSAAVMANRLKQWPIADKPSARAQLARLFDPAARERLRARLRRPPPGERNTDLHPTSYARQLDHWAARLGARPGALLDGLSRMRPFHALLAAVALSLIVIVAVTIGRHPGTVALHATRAYVGMAGMMVVLALLFAFQTLTGELYGQVALLLGAFAAGVALGTAVVRRLDFAGAEKWMLMLQLTALAVGAALAGLLLQRFSQSDWLHTATMIAAMNLAIGALAGSQHAVAMAACVAESPEGDPENAACSLLSMELIGGAVGAVLGGLVLIPAIGMVHTAWAACGLCLAGLPVLFLADGSRQPAR